MQRPVRRGQRSLRGPQRARLIGLCPDSGLLQLLIANFGSMAVPDDGAPADLRHRIEPQQTGHAVCAISVVDSEGHTLRAAGPGEALFLLEAASNHCECFLTLTRCA